MNGYRTGKRTASKAIYIYSVYFSHAVHVNIYYMEVSDILRNIYIYSEIFFISLHYSEDIDHVT